MTTNSDAKTEVMKPDLKRKKDDDDDVRQLDPNTMITLTVRDPRNAGKSPASRWGRVVFNADGEADLKVPLKDVVHVHSFGWLSVEDQEKYLGLEEAQPPTAAEAVKDAEIAAVRGASARLAAKNAELEEKLDTMEARHAKERKEYQDGMGREIEGLRKQLKDQEHASATEISALKSAIKSAQKSAPKAETK